MCNRVCNKYRFHWNDKGHSKQNVIEDLLTKFSRWKHCTQHYITCISYLPCYSEFERNGNVYETIKSILAWIEDKYCFLFMQGPIIFISCKHWNNKFIKWLHKLMKMKLAIGYFVTRGPLKLYTNLALDPGCVFLLDRRCDRVRLPRVPLL